MIVATLFDQFPLLATAPEGVKRLRELILELAVRGKLVPQDPTDEPASELLKRIHAEKAKLVAEGKIKKDKLLPAIGEDEKPFKLPVAWEWTRLADLLPFRIGRTPATKDAKYWSNGVYHWVSIADMSHLSEVRDTSRKLSQAGAEAFGYEPLPVGTLLMSFKLTIGKIAVLSVPAYHNEAIASFLPLGGLDANFLKYVLPLAALNGASKNALMGATLNSESLGNLLLAIPPVDEQHRIVAKVDELMALCDQLEAQQADAASAHATLVKTLLDTLTQSQSAADFEANWQRIAQHFDTLFTTEASIDALKQTLLQLAVMGKLVPQDPSDEPASELLKRIAAEKAKLVPAGKTRKDKPLPPVDADEMPFGLPLGWQWGRLAAIALINPRNTADDLSEASFVPMAMINTSFEGSHDQERRKWGEIKQGFTHFAEGDIGVAKITPCFENSKACVFSGLANGIGAGTTELHIVRPISETLAPRFVLAYLKSPMFLQIGESKMTGTAGQKRLPKEFVEANPFPLPPLAEQHRIVTKVDELMTLCDSLKADLAESRTRHARLAATLIETALQTT